MKRIVAFVLMTLTIAGGLPAAAFAHELTPAVTAKAGELEDKYGISIEYPMTGNGESVIVPNSLEILDAALATVTPSVVRQVSSYYYNKLGRRLTFSYVQSSGLSANRSDTIDVGGADPDAAYIEIYIPTGSGGTVMTGENPISIVHEFGHILHHMIMDSYGYDRMYREWTSYNGGIGYNSRAVDSPDTKIFISGYAATMFEEDVAEVLGHCFIRNKAGQGFTGRLTSNGQKTGLGRKVDYLYSLLAAYFPQDAQMLDNFRKTLGAATSVKYQNMQFSGSYLQFMGYAQPSYILNGTLNVLGKQREHAIWIREIGGWYVREPGGNEIIVFPDWVWTEVPSGFQVPKAG